MEYINGLHSNGRLLALAPHIRLGWKRMAVADTLAYYDNATKYKYSRSQLLESKYLASAPLR